MVLANRKNYGSDYLGTCQFFVQRAGHQLLVGLTLGYNILLRIAVGQAPRSATRRRRAGGIQVSDREGAQANRFHRPGADQANTRQRILHEGFSADRKSRGRIFARCVWRLGQGRCCVERHCCHADADASIMFLAQFRLNFPSYIGYP